MDDQEDADLHNLCDEYVDWCKGHVDGLKPWPPKPRDFWAGKQMPYPNDMSEECEEYWDNLVKADPVLDGKFTIHERAGEGGYGIVWRATEWVTKKKVAVKILKMPAGEAANTEILTQKDFNHNNIVKIIHYGHFEGPHHPRLELESRKYDYVVFEWVEGGTLQGKQLLNEAQVIDWMCELAGAVAHAHSKKVFHRDLKPANVLLTAGRIIKLCDFGIARYPNLGDRTETAIGHPIGTDGYRPPELANGHQEGINYAKVDVWGLGAILYALVTGIAPGNIAKEDRFKNWPASSRLKCICGKCLEADPDVRYETVGDVKKDLAALNVPPVEPVPVIDVRIRPNRRLILAALIAGIAVLVGFIYWPALNRSTAPELVTKIRFKYTIQNGSKDAGVNLIGRILPPSGNVAIAEAGLPDAEIRRELGNYLPTTSAEVGLDPQVGLTDLRTKSYRVAVEEQPVGANAFVRLRYSVEAMDTKGIWHLVVGDLDARHPFNSPEGLPEGVGCYELEDQPRKRPPVTLITRELILR